MLNIITRMENMLNDYEARKKAAADRILALGAELQQEKDLMAAADGLDEFAAHDAKVRYLSARIEAAKNEQIAPLFASQADAIKLGKEYQAAFDAAAAPIYTRMLKTIQEQKKLMKELEKLTEEGYEVVLKINTHAEKTGIAIHPINMPSMLKDFPSEKAEVYFQECLE